MPSFNLFGADESITLIEFQGEEGRYNGFAAAKVAMRTQIRDRLQEYHTEPAFVKDLRYVRLWKLLHHVDGCTEPTDYQWHVLYNQFMAPNDHFPLPEA